MKNVARWLSGGGILVCSLLHPCFAGGGSVSSAWPAGQTYFDEGFFRADGEASALRRQVGAQHRMLSTYLNALHAHGFTLERAVEPPPPDEWRTARPQALRSPVFWVMRCRRAIAVSAPEE